MSSIIQWAASYRLFPPSSSSMRVDCWWRMESFPVSFIVLCTFSFFDCAHLELSHKFTEALDPHYSKLPKRNSKVSCRTMVTSLGSWSWWPDCGGRGSKVVSRKWRWASGVAFKYRVSKPVIQFRYTTMIVYVIRVELCVLEWNNGRCWVNSLKAGRRGHRFISLLQCLSGREWNNYSPRTPWSAHMIGHHGPLDATEWVWRWALVSCHSEFPCLTVGECTTNGISCHTLFPSQWTTLYRWPYSWTPSKVPCCSSQKQSTTCWC